MSRLFRREDHIVNILASVPAAMFDDHGNVLKDIAGVGGTRAATADGTAIGVDRIVMSKGSAFPLHTHEGDHILFVLAGSGSLHVDGVDHPLERGDTVYVAAEHAHGVKGPTDDQVLEILAFGIPHHHVDSTTRMKVLGSSTLPDLASDVNSGRPVLAEPTITGPATLPLQWGETAVVFKLFHFDFGGDRWIAAFTGDITDGDPVPLRIESSCVFGHVMQSAQCDCGYQLRTAMRQFAEAGRGLLVYGLDQDARGLGTAAHFSIYQMRQQEWLDTAKVYERLGASLDSRSYQPAVAVLRHLRVDAVTLLTNNSQREDYLRANGFAVTTQPLEAPLDVYNMSTLMLEKEDMGYSWSFETHAEWLGPIQADVEGAPGRTLACAVVPGRGISRGPLARAASEDWSIARALVNSLPPDREEGPLVVYLTDLPRLDEVSIYAQAGVAVLVAPFAPIPDSLIDAATRSGIRIVDWARRNAYQAPRPQWTFVRRAVGCDIYTRGSNIRVLAELDNAELADKVLKTFTSFLHTATELAPIVERGLHWVEFEAGSLPESQLSATELTADLLLTGLEISADGGGRP
jgi:GTP cyclohydrolase II/quercetin dioxygenase-like cupin family protein